MSPLEKEYYNLTYNILIVEATLKHYDNLEPGHQINKELLTKQLAVMNEYLAILDTRLINENIFL